MGVVQEANQYLQRTFNELEAQTGILEQQRRELVQQVVNEKDLVRIEERQSAELRNTLERVRRQHNAAVAERRESNLREQRIIEMQSDGDVRLPTDRRPRETVQKQGHSWAAALTESKPDRAQPP